MKQKILDLLPRAGALLAALAILISCVAVPARAASTSEAVQYYDITDYNMSGTITGGSTVKLTFNVADYASQYAESYSSSSWSLLITGEFIGTMLCSSYGATYYSKTTCSYQFTLDNDWINTPSINCKQENVGVTGTYRITGAYLINSTYVSKHAAYYWEEEHGFDFSSIYNNLYNFSSVPSDYIVPSSSEQASLVFSPRVIVPCTTLYFELGFDYLVPEDLNISVVACSSSGTITEIYDYEMTLLSSSGYFYQYGIEVTGPFTDFVFVCVDYTLDDGAEIYFNGFYAGYNRILNTNSLLDRISETTTLILNRFTTRLDKIVSSLNSISQAILNGELGSKPATNIFDSWNATITGLSGSFNSVVNAVNEMRLRVVSAVEAISVSVVDGLSDYFVSLHQAIDGISSSVADAFSDYYVSLHAAVESISGDIISGLPDIIHESTGYLSEIKNLLIPDWKSSIFGKVDFVGLIDHFGTSYDSVHNVFGLGDLFTDSDGAFDWLPSGLTDTSDNLPEEPILYSVDSSLMGPNFVFGLSYFWSFAGEVIDILPPYVVLVFSFVFVGFLFVGLIKIF